MKNFFERERKLKFNNFKSFKIDINLQFIILSKSLITNYKFLKLSSHAENNIFYISSS